MTLNATKEKLQTTNPGRKRGPEPWLQRLADASGYSKSYLSRAVNGHTPGCPVESVISEARSKGLIKGRGAK